MKQILVIEDDRVMRENIAELLTLVGYDVEVANDGKEGLKKAQDLLPDLIICDIKMPGLDGYGVLYVLANDPKTTAIPFIFVTAKTEHGDRRKGMEMGADDYLNKPFEDTELLNAVETRLKKSEIQTKEFPRTTAGLDAFFKNANELINIKHLPEEPLIKGYAPRDVIFRAGELPRYIYFVEEGRVKTFNLNENGKEFITNLYNPGDFFGYKPVFEEREYRESAEPLEPVKIRHIPKNDFLELIYRNRDVAGKLINIMSKDLSEKEKELIHMAYDSVRKRVATKLLEIINEEEIESVSIYRNDLAALVGTTTETLVRTLSELKELEIVETDGQTITLLNREKLIEFARAW